MAAIYIRKTTLNVLQEAYNNGLHLSFADRNEEIVGKQRRATHSLQAAITNREPLLGSIYFSRMCSNYRNMANAGLILLPALFRTGDLEMGDEFTIQLFQEPSFTYFERLMRIEIENLFN